MTSRRARPLSKTYLWLAAFAALAAALPAYPWGAEGHKAIGLAAEQNLSPDTQRAVEKILGSTDLASIAIWMDELRSVPYHQGPLADSQEAHAFVKKFPHNTGWHYVDLPLGTKAYDPSGEFSRPDDIVHELELAVSVLEGDDSSGITRLQALRMIVHFVGDLHQPLHVGAGYYKVGADATATLVKDPAAADGLPDDRGGNALYYGPGRFDELHAYWDENLPEKVAGSPEYAKLATVIQNEISKAAGAWKSDGDYHHWPEAWAEESVIASRTAAYAGVTFGAVKLNDSGTIKSIQITMAPDYDATAVPVARERLAKAGFHLAELLNAIHWAN